MNIVSIPMQISSSTLNHFYFRSTYYHFSSPYSCSPMSIFSKTLKFPYSSSSSSNWKMPNFACLSSSSSPSVDTTSEELTTSFSAVTPKPKPKPWLLVGLGNPGKKFNGTRHNVGFEMIDTIAEAEGISMSSVSFKASFGKGQIGQVPVILSKPQTYMNLSGESIYDDLDLPFAKLRLLPKGGHGGHNGYLPSGHFLRYIVDGALVIPQI